MTYDVFIVITIIGTMIFCLLKEAFRPDFILFCALAALVLFGVITPAEAVKGFSNEAILTVALLFIIAGAVQQSEILTLLVAKALGRGHHPRRSLFKMMIPLSGLSAFLNNTPIVVMFTPIVHRWCQNRNISPSKFLIPLSYATIFGGTITLIGTSTNLLAHGLMIENGLPGYSMFQLAVVAVPGAILGTIFMSTIGYSILPLRRSADGHFQITRKTSPEIAVEEKSLIFARKNSASQRRSSKNVYLISSMKSPEVSDRKNTMFAIIILMATVLTAALNIMSMFTAALSAVIVLFLFKIVSFDSAKKYVHFNVLLMIACSIGIGVSLEVSGTASLLADQLIKITKESGVIGMLIVLYFLTNIFTEIITNNAAVVIMFPIALAAAEKMAADPTAFLVTITIAASASFTTPIGYQTNLIVYEPGGYRFTDYFKTGIPLSMIYLIVTVTVSYFVWL
ncbi:Di-and tricarboxylate transporter [Evansella caseinilytica]|uniref:Di-and tricarboxylate transporter n=1 Tax=Evansella caseinilytica TaxID=1503961 RepID=A0A1H3PWF6_9BACI|nr:SLC13 family permease [Evansella caseinilytica]SDZ05155.1 Di-and tricarboxylate transporter [Evansella caseinilytica]